MLRPVRLKLVKNSARAGWREPLNNGISINKGLEDALSWRAHKARSAIDSHAILHRLGAERSVGIVRSAVIRFVFGECWKSARGIGSAIDEGDGRKVRGDGQGDGKIKAVALSNC
jgi:hypothetical protein